jgi:HK97 family phage portal protein
MRLTHYLNQFKKFSLEERKGGLMNTIQKLVARAFGLEVKAKTDDQRLDVITPSSSGKPLARSDWNTKKAIDEGLKASVWVYSCIKRKVDAAAKIPFIVEEKRGDNWERAENHPLEQLLREPNQHLTGKKLIELLVYHLELGGEAYWHIVTARGAPVELWSLMPDQVKPIPSSLNFLDGFEYTIGNKKQILEPQYVAQFLYTDPSSFYRGLSPLKAVAQAVDTDLDAVKFNRVAMQNRSITDGVFSTNQVLSKEQWELIRKQIKEQHTTPDNARTPWVLGAGMNWQQMTNTLEMDFLQSRPFTRDEIYTAFRVPVILDNPTSATFANMDTAKSIFWSDTMLPLLTDICSSITFALVPWFGADASTLRVSPDLSDVEELKQSYQSRVVTASILIKSGYDPQEVSERLNLGLTSVNTASSTDAVSRGAKAFTRQLKSLDWTEETKTTHWKARDDPRQKLEAIAEKAIAELFNADSKRSDYQPDEAAWIATMTMLYDETTKSFAELEGRELVANQKASYTWFDPKRLSKWIKQTAAETIKGILETTRDRIKKEIQASITANETTVQFASRIKDLYSSWSTSRAVTIARTEIGRAANAGSFEGATSIAEQLQTKLQKSWISSRDYRVREEHILLDGETVSAEETFSNGRMYPDEPNCRCVVAYRTAK